MSFISNLLSGGVGSVIEKIGGVVDSLTTTGEEKDAAKLELKKLMQERESEIEQTLRVELQSRERIIVAEMQQGDKVTKWARPSLVYAGLIMTFINYVIVPAVQMFGGYDVKPFELPTQFWAAWGVTVSVWAGGRTAEKLGIGGKVAKKIGGNSLPEL